MDKSWIYEADRLKSAKYSDGVQDFMSVAHSYADSRGMIRCPCKRCKNVLFKHVDKMEDHLYIIGFDQSYTHWVFHRESISEVSNRVVTLKPEPRSEDFGGNINDDMRDMLEDFEAGAEVDENTGENILGPETVDSGSGDGFSAYTKLWADAEIGRAHV